MCVSVQVGRTLPLAVALHWNQLSLPPVVLLSYAVSVLRCMCESECCMNIHLCVHIFEKCGCLHYSVCVCVCV